MNQHSKVCVIRSDGPRSYDDAGGALVTEQVRAVLREAAVQAGGDPAEGLGRWIRPGMRVFLLCNFVQHRRPTQTQKQLEAKCTHSSVVRGVCDEVLRVLDGSGSIAVGNAPLQSTDWDAVMSDTGMAALLEGFRMQGQSVRAVDLRMMVRQRGLSGLNREPLERVAETDCRAVEMGDTSRLSEVEWLGEGEPAFRVMDYDPERTTSLQNRHRHTYWINREILEADVVISIPKLKTHEKVGITCGLKGFVGIVGHKDCLAHHRFGGPSRGGDEYPSNSHLRFWQSAFHDYCQRRGGRGLLRRLGMVVDRNLTRVLGRMGAIYGGAWEGNDTCWRMAWDLTRIVHFADQQGRLKATPQRVNLCLVDGIIAGEGKGPLSPTAVRSGVLLFSDHLGLGDVAASMLMGYDPARIPLVREGFSAVGASPADLAGALESEVYINGLNRKVSDLRPVLGRPFVPSPGWRGLL
jgi:uncharacterized protein (DUF362 family)